MCLTEGCFSGSQDVIVEETFNELNCHAEIRNKNKKLNFKISWLLSRALSFDNTYMDL